MGKVSLIKIKMADYDDLFGDVQQQAPAFDDFNNFQGGMGGGNNYEYNVGPSLLNEVDQEEQAIADRVAIKEEERRREYQQQSNDEYQQKLERKRIGQQVLEQMVMERDNDVQRKKANNAYQEAETQNLGDNSWSMVCNNIALKEGEYPGSKDVKAMRTAIVNKRNDMQKMADCL